MFLYSISAQKIRTTTLTKNALKNDFPKEYYVHKLAEKTTEVETLEKRIKTLESQIGMEQVPSTCNSRDIKSSFEDLYKEAVPWQQLINKVYDALHHAQSNYFPLHSKEQILKVRTKFKEYLEENRKAFNIDGEFMDRVSREAYLYIFHFLIALITLQQDIARAQASIGKFSKQIETFEADRARWMQRYKDARGELLKIEAEIAKQVTRPAIVSTVIFQPSDDIRPFSGAFKYDIEAVFEVETIGIRESTMHSQIGSLCKTAQVIQHRNVTRQENTSTQQRNYATKLSTAQCAPPPHRRYAIEI